VALLFLVFWHQQLIILEGESFTLRQLTFLPACGLAHSTAAYDGGFGV